MDDPVLRRAVLHRHYPRPTLVREGREILDVRLVREQRRPRHGEGGGGLYLLVLRLVVFPRRRVVLEEEVSLVLFSAERPLREVRRAGEDPSHPLALHEEELLVGDDVLHHEHPEPPGTNLSPHRVFGVHLRAHGADQLILVPVELLRLPDYVLPAEDDLHVLHQRRGPADDREAVRVREDPQRGAAREELLERHLLPALEPGAHHAELRCVGEGETAEEGLFLPALSGLSGWFAVAHKVFPSFTASRRTLCRGRGA